MNQAPIAISACGHAAEQATLDWYHKKGVQSIVTNQRAVSSIDGARYDCRLEVSIRD